MKKEEETYRVEKYDHNRFKEALLELCTHIWNGDDYIPLIIDKWALDGNLDLIQLLHRTSSTNEMIWKLAGFGALEKTTDHIYTIKGLRVHPNARGRGYSEKISSVLVDIGFEKRKAKEVRYVSTTENKATREIAKNLGFENTGTIELYRIPYDEVSFNFLRSNVPIRSYELIKEWKQLTLTNYQTILGNALDKMTLWSSKYETKEYASEFDVIPLSAKKTGELVSEGSMFVLDEPPAIMICTPTFENKGATFSCVVTTNHIDAVGAALLHVLQATPSKRIYFFVNDTQYINEADNFILFKTKERWESFPLALYKKYPKNID